MSGVRGRILTFAIVQQEMAGNDPIAALAPFISPIATDFDGQKFDASSFRVEMQRRYGISLSRDVTEIFFQRLVKLNYLRRAEVEHVWVRQASDVEDRGGEAAQRLDEVVSVAKKFYETRSELISEPFDEEKFLDALMSVLLDQNTALKAAVTEIEKVNGDEDSVLATGARSTQEYYASEFIAWTASNRKEVFGWLADLSGTALVSEALIEVRTPTNSGTIKPDLSVYLDTPVLMELLGCSGTAARDDTLLLVSTLRNHQIGVYVLKHSLEELHRNISAVLHMPEVNRIGPTGKALLYREVTIPYLKNVLQTPEHFIRGAGVQVVDPKTLKHLVEEQCFTEEDAQNFYAMIFSLHAKNEPRQHDVDSISWIMRRRKRATSSDILRSKHILLTRNDQLVKSANRIAIERAGYGRDVWGAAVSARDLAGVLWLIVGQAERTEISKRQLILSCDRARSSAPQIIRGMLDILESVDPRNADLLWVAVQKPAYLSLALDAAAASPTIGAEEAATLSLTKIRDDLIADERARNAKSMARQKDKFDAEAALTKSVVFSLENEKTALEQQNEDLVARLRNISDGQWKRSRWWARGVFRVTRIIFQFMVLGALVIASIFGTDVITMHWAFKACIAFLCGVFPLYLANEGVSNYIQAKINKLFRASYETKVRKLVGSDLADVVMVREAIL